MAWVRTFGFTLVGLTAGFAGIVYESRLGSISVGFDGGTYVLYAVAAAVIGGASLMGGRGKAIHPLIGGLVLAVVALLFGVFVLIAGRTRWRWALLVVMVPCAYVLLYEMRVLFSIWSAQSRIGR